MQDQLVDLIRIVIVGDGLLNFRIIQIYIP